MYEKTYDNIVIDIFMVIVTWQIKALSFKWLMIHVIVCAPSCFELGILKADSFADIKLWIFCPTSPHTPVVSKIWRDFQNQETF